MAEAFNPRDHLMKLKGKDYLEVKWRSVWFRAEHPDGLVETELVELDRDSGYAMFKALVQIPGGGGATGYGSETAKDFPDYAEKAETKALGRALAALGYGTQFCDDLAMLNPDGTPHVVDAPVARKAASQPSKPSNRPSNSPPTATKPVSQAKPAPAPEQPGASYACADCGKELTSTPDLSAHSLAALSLKKHQRILCTDCSMAERRKQAQANG